MPFKIPYEMGGQNGGGNECRGKDDCKNTRIREMINAEKDADGLKGEGIAGEELSRSIYSGGSNCSRIGISALNAT